VVPFGLAANGEVAYGRAGDIWLGDPRSGDTRLFLGDPAAERGPVWSLDGARLAFIRDDGSGEKLYVVNADGSGLLELTPDPLIEAGLARWSPDGRSIAIEHTVSGRFGVSVVRTDGGGVQRLNLEVAATGPEWRPPDGRQLLIRGVARTGEPNLYTVDPDGGGLRSLELTGSGLDRGATDFLGASWSPDGRRILYGGLEFKDPLDGFNRYRTHIVGADGSGDRVIDAPEDISDVWPVWSPDGRFIHFERVRGEYLGQGADVWLAIAAAEGPGLVEITEVSDPSGLEAIWAPDGTRLLARYATLGTTYEIDSVDGTARALSWTTSRDFSWQRR
jgi:Tol biopolymer transport system component